MNLLLIPIAFVVSVGLLIHHKFESATPGFIKPSKEKKNK